MMILIVAEKPKVALKIASALGKPEKKKKNNAPYYVVGDIVVAPAVGHLYHLKSAVPFRDYPVFDVEWVPTDVAYAKSYVKNLQFLAKDADEFVNACDYDVEGSVIGYNALRFACKADISQSRRMRYSTLTTTELASAFDSLEPPGFAMIDAGLARHELDWIWGMNVSKALSSSLKTAVGQFKLLSAGRVQTPTLVFLEKREREIAGFISEPYWEVIIEFQKDGIPVQAKYPQRLTTEEEAQRIYQECLGATGVVTDLDQKKKTRNPPIPMDLGLLQSECWKNFRYTPQTTQKLAQGLYEMGAISYPRTASQKLPAKLDFKRILKGLSGSPQYATFASEIMQTALVSAQGRKDDPAHPAIHPTGDQPKKLTAPMHKVYDLIVKRFFAGFADPSVYQSTKVEITVGEHPFLTQGNITVKDGWLRYYRDYAKIVEEPLPHLEKGEEVEVTPQVLSKETKPPPRYNPASAVKMMEKLGIGTKATRAQIIDILYERGYITEKQIEVTPLGEKTVEALTKDCPQIVSVRLTRHFEKEMDEIYEGKKEKDAVITEAQKELTGIFEKFKEKEAEIGKIIYEGLKETLDRENVVGTCPLCGEKLRIIRSKKTRKRFVGCSGYPNCTHSYPLPQKGKVAPTEEVCECGAPLVKISGRTYCLNPSCESHANNQEIVGICPACGKDLKLIYSKKTGKRFVGCSGYPACTRSYPLPQRGNVTFLNEKCECGAPLIILGKKKEKQCIDPKHTT
ncbi:MAG: DNA topoisomerase I [Theionarchaea archaeon]|nr:DNA topoisomerase I [Theionarchaea archaeon]MBU7037014.1 DNA topoisomerase I [Theionarchaea archaeon]